MESIEAYAANLDEFWRNYSVVSDVYHCDMVIAHTALQWENWRRNSWACS